MRGDEQTMPNERRASGGDPPELEAGLRDILPDLEVVPALKKDTPAKSLTEAEERELVKLWENYDEFHSELRAIPGPECGSSTAAVALHQTLYSAKQIVDLLLRVAARQDHAGIVALWAQVAECEEQAHDMLHRLARLRRKLQ